MPKDETKSLLNHTKKPPPPAYSAYFDDPTMYAQIDHCNYSKSSTATLLASSGQSLNNGSLKTAGGSALMTDSTSQFNQLISPLTHTSSTTLGGNSTTMLIGAGNVNVGGTLPFTTTTPTYTSITTTGAVSPYQSSNYHTQTLPLTSSSNNKQFLRDLVTVKTPLSFSEQESCV
jgi:hypothetical protein